MKLRKKDLSLTKREQEVLRLLVDGYSNVETGIILDLSRRTVEAHRARIMLKLNLHDLPALVKYSIREGLASVFDHRTIDDRLTDDNEWKKTDLHIHQEVDRSINNGRKKNSKAAS
jgi:DNA-binding CsgD family transcriptional regulator